MDDDHLKTLCAAAFEQQVAARNGYDQLLKSDLQEFARKAAREVDEVFEALRALPDDVHEIPWIGGTYPPHAPLEKLAPLKQRIVRARCCQHLFEFEAPRWAHPLPLRVKDCRALYNQPKRRLMPVGRYGELLRAMEWHYQRAPLFTDYYAEYCAPPPPQEPPWALAKR
jgi:hypothetical protein